MSYVIAMPNGRYVYKHDGMNDFVRNPRDATVFYTKADAIAGKPGHHRDMGGSGFKGTVTDRDTAIRHYDAWQAAFGHYRR